MTEKKKVMITKEEAAAYLCDGIKSMTYDHGRNLVCALAGLRREMRELFTTKKDKLYVQANLHQFDKEDILAAIGLWKKDGTVASSHAADPAGIRLLAAVDLAVEKGVEKKDALLLAVEWLFLDGHAACTPSSAQRDDEIAEEMAQSMMCRLLRPDGASSIIVRYSITQVGAGARRTYTHEE